MRSRSSTRGASPLRRELRIRIAARMPIRVAKTIRTKLNKKGIPFPTKAPTEGGSTHATKTNDPQKIIWLAINDLKPNPED
ncbi:hypothetical protein RA210_U390002 [Rubrivivax sp. A210]|nr:hypothetical protein RA210_U390002 [Rubrivivax sp. A210]